MWKNSLLPTINSLYEFVCMYTHTHSPSLSLCLTHTHSISYRSNCSRDSWFINWANPWIMRSFNDCDFLFFLRSSTDWYCTGGAAAAKRMSMLRVGLRGFYKDNVNRMLSNHLISTLKPGYCIMCFPSPMATYVRSGSMLLKCFTTFDINWHLAFCSARRRNL